MTTAALKPITTQVQLTAALASIYSVISYSFVTISRIHLCNCSASPMTVRVCFVPRGQTAVQSNAALWDFSIGANDFIEVCDQEILAAGTTVWASASSAGWVNMFFSGIGQ